MFQSEELSNMYYESVGYNKILPGFKKKSIEAINSLLQNGVNYTKIVQAIEYYVSCWETYGDKPFISLMPVFGLDEVKTILKVESEPCDNLIDKARFYYHKRLRLSPSAPKVIVDENGNCTTTIEKFYLEMTKTFSSKDLLEYFYSVHNVDTLYRKEKRDMAAVKYIIEQYKDYPAERINWLDVVLYMIDVSRQEILDNDRRTLINILHIQDYEVQALELLEDKMNYERINGVDKIVEREQLNSRDGWSK